MPGAGLYNSIFAPPGAIVLEIFNPARWEHSLARLASLCGHTHWHVFGRNEGAQWETSVDLKRLEKALDYALDGLHGEPTHFEDSY